MGEQSDLSTTVRGCTTRMNDGVIDAIRRLDEMKQQLAAKDAQLRQKQRDIDRLYGKLAAASPLTDTELRSALLDAVERLAHFELHKADGE